MAFLLIAVFTVLILLVIFSNAGDYKPKAHNIEDRKLREIERIQKYKFYKDFIDG